VSETWYRPSRWSNALLEEVEAVAETEHFLTVLAKDWTGKVGKPRRQAKDGACKTKKEALANMLVDAQRTEHYAQDELSRKIQRRKQIEQAIKELP
jgi:hypothetical protein